MAHQHHEARQIAAAARKYDRLVQHGTNLRSDLATREAIEKLHGDVAPLLNGVPNPDGIRLDAAIGQRTVKVIVPAP